MSSLNNRDLATGIWVLVALVWALSTEHIRHSIVNLLRAFFHPKVLLIVCSMVLYTACVVAFLAAVGLWEVILLKDTVLWFCFTGFVMVVSSVPAETSTNVFRRFLADSVKVVVLVEFIVNAYTFSLPVELLLVPVVTLIAVMAAVASLKEEHASVAKVTTGLLAVIGFVVLSFAAVKAASDYSTLASMDTVRKVLLAPVLSVLFSLFVYAMLLAMNYELLFLRLSLGPEKDAALRRYAKHGIVLHCRFSLSRAQNLLRAKGMDLTRAGSRNDIDNIFREFP